MSAMRPAIDTLCAAGTSVMVVTALLGCQRPTDAEGGRALFASSCARCHGIDGAGGLPAFDGGPSPRNFRDRAFQATRSDEQIKQTIVNGKGTAMPPFGTLFTDTQLTALVAHVRSLDSTGGR